MLPYFAFFSTAAVPAVFYSRRLNLLGWLAVWTVFVLFLGLRHRVGGDFPGYVMITQGVAVSSFAESATNLEPLFLVLTWASVQLGTGVYGVNLVGAAIFSTGLFAYCRTLPNPWLALSAAVPFLTIVTAMSANRQAIAIGVVLFTMARWESSGFLKRSLGIAIASLFHASASLLMILTIVDLKISTARKLALAAPAGLLGLWLLGRSEEAADRYVVTYIEEQPEGVFAPGAIFHLLLNLGPAVVMLAFQKKWKPLIPNWDLIRHLSLLALVLLPLVPLFSVATSRMSLYLFPVSISFLAALGEQGPSPAMVRIPLLVVLGGTLALWLSFANTAFTFIPYQNVLFVNPRQLDLPYH